MNEFDAIATVELLKNETTELRKPRYRRSRLDRYKAELISLKTGGATNAEIQRWLRKKHIKVDHRTVGRWIEKHVNGKVRSE
ncbi:hypothetical protein C9J52_19740 [Photobacterium iliopiscarium]|uniref:Helix-turn-helix domain-containing protein n=1 Tax=Photobacterium iliopiscarium TaxID=56192 RepID=A0ABX5GMC3_9GAMM|nr:hypothetical protein C9J52_19740 [Photobacterium iliopiscarium]